MTITPMTPAPTRLAGDVDQAEETLALVRDSLDCAGEGARMFSRNGITVQTAGEVEAFAAKWCVAPFWTAGRTQYVARRTTGGHGAQAEVVYFAPETAGSEAAA